ncbi:MAG: M24 family metallopeptidase [Anaerolineaceae bacterium]|nr:M24 family metallopeptidase [Anaerolineaceae bacterium]
MNEYTYKQNQLKAILDRYKVNGLLLHRVSSFSWATCGVNSAVNISATNGTARLLITKDKNYLITKNIEAPRLEQEGQLKTQGWEFIVTPWYESEFDPREIIGDGPFGADICYPGAIDLSAEISSLRSNLIPEEQIRFKELGGLCASTMSKTMNSIEPGMTEFEIASILSSETEKQGIKAIVNLVATDERIFKYRHPLPTEKQLEKYAMVVLCGRKWGLVCSLSRLIHFGKIPIEIQNKINSVAKIDVEFIKNTRPGKTMGEVFSQAKAAYQKEGYPDEWLLHHQGGLTGYEPRESLAGPEFNQVIRQGQFFAWNPSISGVKSEDTIFVGETENEVITKIKDWPTIDVSINGIDFQRPAILKK